MAKFWLLFRKHLRSQSSREAQHSANCEGPKPFLKECSSQRRLIVLLNLYWFLLWQCLILADTFWGTRIHITELKPLPHRHLISYRHSGPCPDCGSVHQATLHIGQALKLGLSAFPFSYVGRGDSETSGANARHLWLTFAPKQWARPWVSSPPERLNRSMIYQMNWIWVEKHKLIKLEESQPPWHLVKCFTSAANCVLWSFRTQLLSFAVLRLFGAIVLVTKTSAQVGSSWHHMNHEKTSQFDTIPTSTRSVKAIFHQTDRTNYLSAKALVHPASHRPSVSSEVTKK